MKDLFLPTVNSMSGKDIEKCIFEVRGHQVMLDSDVAGFFEVETRALNQQMKRNIDRFPSDFCFQLNSIEFKNLTSQNVTSSYGGRRTLPYVYTEHGIIALAGVLKSDIAKNMSVEIVRKFIQMRTFILENSDISLSLAKLQNRQLEFECETNKRFDAILKLINKMDLPKTAVFYENHCVDASEFIISIIKKAFVSIKLIDPYCDSKAFNYLKHRNEGTLITIYNSSHSKLSDDDVINFKIQCGDITVKTLDTIHDRYLIIDDCECYSLGTSLNYVGKKLFTINKIEDDFVIKSIIDAVSD